MGLSEVFPWRTLDVGVIHIYTYIFLERFGDRWKGEGGRVNACMPNACSIPKLWHTAFSSLRYLLFWVTDVLVSPF